MTNYWSVWSVLVGAMVLANLPFFSERLLCCYALRGSKTLFIRFLELLLGYCLSVALGMGLEMREGQSSPQGWEFYVITFFLFLTFAFPGFVYRYLLRRSTVN